MNIFIHELKAHWRSFLIWAGTMLFLIAAGMMKYSAFQKTGESINDLFNSMPEEMLTVFGMSGELDLTSVGVFYSIFFLYFILLMSVHSTMLGASIIAKEERDKTAEFLLVKPIKRHQVITPKILAAFVLIFLYNLFTFVSSILLVAPLNDTEKSLTVPIFYLMVALFFLQTLFLGIGFFLGAWVKSAERASGIGTGVILGTFVLKVIIDLKPDYDYLDFLTPFRYFASREIMLNENIPAKPVLICMAIAIIGVAGAYFFFQKRDIKN